MRVCIAPSYQGPDRADGGIRRVIEAMYRHLPNYDIQITDNPNDADLINCHGAMLVEAPGVPMVASCHGLYWHDYDWGAWAHDTNNHVIETMVRAQEIIAPSEWVAHAISRGMLAQPKVIYHGVDAKEWLHEEKQLGYVLWNKARTDQVSDPTVVQRIAELLPDVPFVSTFGEPRPNIHLLGAVPYEQMKNVVQRAGLYLATARETFGIGTLEALASGVPVVGWRYGGQEEIVIEGATGYLVEPGDYDALAEAIQRAFADRERLGANALDDVRERWGWQDKMMLYASLFQSVVTQWRRPRPTVSVIVTCHNLARYLSDALHSVREQTLTDFECLIVDDASTDETPEISQQVVAQDTRFRYLRTPQNLKLSGARNYGFQHATGRYIQFLDADDMLAPNALDLLSRALDMQSSIHIAYGHLDIVNHAGGEQRRNPWPRAQFDWHQQMAHLNQFPYAAMMRRDVLAKSGGYRNRDWRAEDASFWCRVTSLGFRAAKVTEEATLLYRLRNDSKSIEESRVHADRDGDWTAWYPWRVGARSAKEGEQAVKEKKQPPAHLVPWSAQGAPPPTLRAWPVRHHQHPTVSVIIPVGPGHEAYLTDALDSLVAQTMPDWEVIVVNNTHAPLDVSAHPFTRFAYTWKTEAGGARNAGLEEARAPLVLFLDADDVLMPNAIEKMLRVYLESGGKYVYCDCAATDDPQRLDGPLETYPSADYDQQLWVASGYEPGMPGRHSIVALVPTEDARHAGFDEELAFWEDWDFFMRLAVAGVCGVRVPEPLFIYRLHTGERRKNSLAQEKELRAALRQRYEAYARGEKDMAGCCGGNARAMQSAQRAIDDFGLPVSDGQQQSEGFSPRLEFIGDTWGAQSYAMPSGKIYRGGRNPLDRYIDAAAEDIEHLLKLGVWRTVRQPAEAMEPGS